MTRQQGNDRDPAGNWIAGTDRTIIFDRIASLLTSAEWQVLKLFYGIDYDPPITTFRAIETEPVSEEYEWWAWQQAREKITTDENLLKILPDLLGRPKIPGSLQEAAIIKCRVPGHGFSTIEGIPCKGCECRMQFDGRGARNVEYCSNSCKQRAYRRRKKSLG